MLASHTQDLDIVSLAGSNSCTFRQHTRGERDLMNAIEV